MDREHDNGLVAWPPLQQGSNELGPTDLAGEYRASEDIASGPPNGALDGRRPGARVPGEVRPMAQPIDIASQSKVPPTLPELSAAERDVDDPRHIARGKGSMSSSEGSS